MPIQVTLEEVKGPREAMDGEDEFEAASRHNLIYDICSEFGQGFFLNQRLRGVRRESSSSKAYFYPAKTGVEERLRSDDDVSVRLQPC